MANSLRLEFTAASSEGAVNDGWGQATLYWNEEPYWHAGVLSDGRTRRIEWTWVDLLQWLAKNWLYLTNEQTLPLAWMNDVNDNLAKILDSAEEHWQGVSEERLDAEEIILLEYLNRHNLANALQGIYVPAVFWRRVGNEVVLYREDGVSMRVPLNPLLQHFEDIGSRMVEAWKESENPRVRLAIDQWRRRAELPLVTVLSISSGLEADEIRRIQGEQDAGEFWGTHSVTDMLNGQDTDMLAAARMSSHVLKPEAMTRLVGNIRSCESRQTPVLDELCNRLMEEAQAWHDWRPYDQAYALAEWLRRNIGLKDGSRVNPQEMLELWNVAVTDIDLDGADIDAVACWGLRGPAIFMNTSPEWRSQGVRRRASLAHEICHLLFDRKSALPVAEVLGGAVDPIAEQRARAFAAELLLPRTEAHATVQRANELIPACDELAAHYDVSRKIVTNQIKNSGVPLNARERAELDRWAGA
ncbi:MAG: ImmA/IrrE family metallo-endopeptidase [Proteobacteria bacterium]|nr:ImmA/IrrE family metallo-endopeptidase [Pseudomonadota bacterium]